MDLREYARVLFKRGWMILLIAAVGAVGALGFSWLQPTIYRSVITLSATPTRPSDYGQTLAIKNLVLQYSRQLQTKAIAQKVLSQLKYDISVEKFLSEISVSSSEADLTLDIEVKDRDINMVGQLTQTLAETFVVQHQQENLQIDQQDRILVSILENASPAEKFSPKTTINVLAGGILGTLVGTLVVFVLEFLQSAFVRSTEDIERYLGLTVLGAIPTMPKEKG
ncbi:MAG: Wzz/FepE/Etk N-terminal domain-containing protein [Anaerolineae bacterium]